MGEVFDGNFGGDRAQTQCTEQSIHHRSERSLRPKCYFLALNAYNTLTFMRILSDSHAHLMSNNSECDPNFKENKACKIGQNV